MGGCRRADMQAMIIEAVWVLHLVSPTYNFATKGLVLASVLDDIPRVVYFVKRVLTPFMIHKHTVLFAWVECSVGIFCCRPVISGTNKGEPNRLTTRNEKYSDDRVVQMDSSIDVAFDWQVHSVPLVDIMEQVGIQWVRLWSSAHTTTSIRTNPAVIMGDLGNKGPTSSWSCHVTIRTKCVPLRFCTSWVDPVHTITLTLTFEQYIETGLSWWWVANLSPQDSLQLLPLFPAAEEEMGRFFVVPQFAFRSSIARFGCRRCKNVFATTGAAVSFITLKDNDYKTLSI